MEAGKNDVRLPKLGRFNSREDSLTARRRPIRRRSILFADGFYECCDRRPFYYTLRSGRPFALASLWDPEADRPHCDIITTEPNTLVVPVHDRMPAILQPDTIDLWLDPKSLLPEVAASVLRPYPSDEMTVREVSALVNNAKYDGPDIAE